MKNKIYILTYCTWLSLGSILQAYAIFTILERNGCNSTIWLEERNRKFVKGKVHSLRTLLKSIFDLINKREKKDRFLKRTRFVDNNLNIEYFEQCSDFNEKAKECDNSIYLAGSDQIWHPDNCNPIFFLDFVKNKKRISYAASMGKTIIEPDKKNQFQSMINNFDSISVREDECAEVIRQMTEKEVEVHIDPTFLISADEWRDISKPYNIKEPYILLYMLYWDEACKEKIKTLKNKTGLKVYAVADGLSRVYADKVLYDVGVEEFLWLIDHAEYVVTSSFHGVAFSTIFNKKYSAIINPKAPSRIKNLLRKLSLPCINIEELDSTCAFNYQLTNQLINKEKARSIEYLKRVLE